jgi:malate dehydrogenase
LPCAAYLNGQYGVKDLFVGVPAVLGAGGVERIVELQLNSTEKAMLAKSVASVRDLVDVCKAMRKKAGPSAAKGKSKKAKARKG